MLWLACVSALVCVRACVCSIIPLDSNLNYDEGEVCKSSGSAVWSCRLKKDCPKAQNGGNRIQLCNSKGQEEVVCCEPEEIVSRGSVSKRMCKKYAESVFLKIADPFNEDEPIILDTCNTGEPVVGGDGTRTSSSPGGMRDAEHQEFPHMALIGYGDKGSIEWGQSAGTLISDQFVLSTAHYVELPNTHLRAKWVRLGDYNIYSKDDEAMGLAHPQEYEITEIIVHPDFNSSSRYNDIALYKLNATVEFNEFIRPICLQTEHQIPIEYAIASGWEKEDAPFDLIQSGNLRKKNMSISVGKRCRNTYEHADKTMLGHGILDASMLCYGDVARWGGACEIEQSGAPLQVRLATPYCMYAQVGVMAFGIRCPTYFPSVSTRVSYFVPWIESVVWPHVAGTSNDLEIDDDREIATI